jgi:hypothetical protein
MSPPRSMTTASTARWSHSSEPWKAVTFWLGQSKLCNSSRHSGGSRH